MASQESNEDTKSSDNSNMKRRVTDEEWNRYTSRIRDAGFLILGLAGTVNQLFYANPPNPVLFPILAALLGAPFALALDQRRREGHEQEQRGDNPSQSMVGK